MKRIKNPWLSREGYDCFGCCPTNPIGLHLNFYEDGDYVVCNWNPSQHYQGWLNTLHGGIMATLLDETAGWVVFRKLQTSGMTTSMDIKFRKSVSTLETCLTIKARLKEMRRNLAFIEVELIDSQGNICVSGTIVYFTMTGDKAKALGFEDCMLEDED